MRKKALCAVLSVAMVASMFAACGSDSSSSSGSSSASSNSSASSSASSSTTASDSSSPASSSGESSSADPVSTEWTAKIQAPSTDGWDDSKKIYAWSWDDDFQKKLSVVLDHYPQYKPYVEFNILGVGGTSDDYKKGIKEGLTSDKYPSLIPADNDVAKYFTEDDSITLNLSDIGLTADIYNETSYKWAADYGTYNGNLKAVTWQGCPGTIFYRRDIAKDVFGTDDPAEIQKKLASWDEFFKAADELKAKGYSIVSGYQSIKYAMWDGQTQPWVKISADSESLDLDSAVDGYLENAKKLADGGYTQNANMWADSAWYANMDDSGKVFCYFGCPWFIGVMTGGKKDDDGNVIAKGATNGNWAACVGPQAYHWGGTYVAVGKDTPNKELCAFLLYALACDPAVGVDIVNKYGDCVNNKVANAQLKDGKLDKDNNAAVKFLGGQDIISVWMEAEDKLDLSKSTYADATIKNYIDKAAESYVGGTFKSIDECKDFIAGEAKKELGI